MTAYQRTVSAVGLVAILLAVVETLAFASRLFVPITWTMIDAANTTTILPFAWTFLGGHFFPPRGAGWRGVVALLLVGASAALIFKVSPPAAAALAGYPCGCLFFPSADRRKA